MDVSNMNTALPPEVLEKLGKVKTDSDVMDIAEEYGISVNKLGRYMAEQAAPTCCKGCEYVVNRGAFSPCTECTRGKQDYYSPFSEKHLDEMRET